MGKLGKALISALVIYLIVLPLLVSAAEEEHDCGCSAAVYTATALKYKIIAIFSTLIVGVFGVCLPIIGLDLDGVLFAFIRAKAACVILFICILHILPDATESLRRDEPPWGDFPMAKVVAMAAAIITMIESFASAFMKRSHKDENQNSDQTHVRNNASKGHSHNNIRQKLIISQVLELGIFVHSVIIGISLGASPRLSTVKPLISAITLHQLFEGIGLGRCIFQAKFELKKSLVMVIVFSLTTPVGIGIGIGVADFYNENSPTTLMVSGFLNAAAAGILFFMAFVINHSHNAHSIFKMLLAFVFVFSWVLF